MNKEMKIVPELRFPDFEGDGEWTVEELNNHIDFQTGYPFKSSNFNDTGKGVRLVKNRDLKSDDGIVFYDGDYNEEYIINNGDILVGMDGDFTPRYWNKGTALLNQRVGRVKAKNKQSERFFEYFLSIKLQEIEKNTARTTVKHLSHSVVEKIKAPLPQPQEQQKIASCLSSLDELIAAHNDKLDALKDHKKGLLQNLFPQEGETVPKVRFPEFLEKDGWEIKEVGEIFQVTRGYVLSMTLVKQVPTEEYPYPVFSSQTKNNGLAGYYNEYLYEDAITWTTDGANAGDVNYRDGKFYCTNVCGVLLNEEGFANPCIAELINSVSKKHVSYVGNPKLMNGVMSKIQIPVPSIPEQQKIASCLSAVDELITAQQEKIDELQQHKKGLMQGLFPRITD